MKRSLSALLLLAALVAALGAAGIYLRQSTARVDTALQIACVLAQNGQYKTSAAAYREAAAEAEHAMRLWGLLVRRNTLEALQQTLACLPGYAQQDNLADLWVETARARCQLRQLTASFFGSF